MIDLLRSLPRDEIFCILTLCLCAVFGGVAAFQWINKNKKNIDREDY